MVFTARAKPVHRGTEGDGGVARARQRRVARQRSPRRCRSVLLVEMTPVRLVVPPALLSRFEFQVVTPST